MWRDSGGKMKLKDIAAQLGVSDSKVRKWKAMDKWDEKLNGTLQNAKGSAPHEEKERSNKKKRGAPPGNENAKGNIGGGAPIGNQNAKGHGAPLRNDNAVTHGLFRKFLPDDDDTIELMEAINERGPLEMLWDAIVIKHTNIIRSQKILFIENKDDETRVVKKQKGYYAEDEKSGEQKFYPEEIEFEYQHAWDKQASALNAYARAMSELRGLIKDYLTLSGEDDHRRLQLAKMEQSMDVEQEKLKLAKEKFELEKAKIIGNNKDKASTMSPEERRARIDALERKRRN
jgi:uncharacterized protein YjcR